MRSFASARMNVRKIDKCSDNIEMLVLCVYKHSHETQNVL